MANIVRNHLVVIGLKESPEEFAQALETELYGRAVPHEAGDLYVEVVTRSGSQRSTHWWSSRRYVRTTSFL